MSSESMTIVYYHIPEDFDDPAMPNAFAVPKPLQEITLDDIEKSFPLGDSISKNAPTPSSQKQRTTGFYFRFKYKFNGNVVWLDISNYKVKVPKCDDEIIMKVTRKNPKYTLPQGDRTGVQGDSNIEDFFAHGAEKKKNQNSSSGGAAAPVT
eukprot:CAMPEP_0170493512 /NCGR_PEP_ID=MMETSP0208-20121228/14020_1 /TAXON_ID=197538 /ORGANISM="Strombidium inclinatum, Strain S3" /LENGTH=151 /DNA_ID=CAMNT_0010769449 /DNA_START=13 /DNA_END=468 /DNA_ORIENTATION=+